MAERGAGRLAGRPVCTFRPGGVDSWAFALTGPGPTGLPTVPMTETATGSMEPEPRCPVDMTAPPTTCLGP
jgi:hypothetical protein